ncbi:MAG TPA: lysylphosphatidylglycerol synthase transmembrane domain-containing protein [Dehalococcoidia bacterium]|nr:lysylphosphatidylglycerol synthase transmembrane domain-containing protein [Dehalococcoidia bacterium]
MSAVDGAMRGWLRSGRLWLGLAGTALFLGLFFARTDLGELWDALREADYRWAVPAVALWFLSAWFRSLRWGLLLSRLARLGANALYPVLVIGYMANNLLPARLGEVVRAYVLGQRYGLSKMSVLGSIAAERLVDALVLLVLMTSAAAFVGLEGHLQALSLAAVAAVMVGFAVLYWAASHRATVERALGVALRPLPWALASRLRGAVDAFLDGTAALRSPLLLAAVALCGGIAWLLEAGMYYLVGRAFDLGEGFAVYLVLAGAANLAITVPSTSGGIGPFEWASREVLVAAGVASGAASAYALALHGLLLVPVIVVGLLFLWGVQLAPTAVLAPVEEAKAEVGE